MFLEFIVYIIAGLGAGIGTGLAGLSAAAVISYWIFVITAATTTVCTNFIK